MGRFIDLTGQTFSELTVLERDDEKRYCVHWWCQCSCGNKVLVAGTHLRSGHTKSCGCLQKKKASESNLKNILGQRFGKLVAIKRLEDKKSSGVYKYLCKCDCGEEVIVDGSSLRTGNTKSCGCIRSRGESLIANILKTNNVSYKREWTTDLKSRKGGALRFDFALYQDGKLFKLIEFNGKQHYTASNTWGGEEALLERKENDSLKVSYCREKGIPLLVIPYWEEEKITLDYLLTKE